MLLWMSRHSLNAALRWLSVAALPVVLLALYFTYSRGGLLALLVACGCLIALSHDRLWLLATLAIGVLAALPAVLAMQGGAALADNIAGQAAIDQGVTVLLILVAGCLLAVGLFWLMRRLERGEGVATGRALEMSRNPTLLKGVAVALAVLAIGAVVAVGGRAWDQFSSSDMQFTSYPEQHFNDLSGAGRERNLAGGDRRLRRRPGGRARRRHLRASPGTSCARST